MRSVGRKTIIKTISFCFDTSELHKMRSLHQEREKNVKRTDPGSKMRKVAEVRSFSPVFHQHSIVAIVRSWVANRSNKAVSYDWQQSTRGLATLPAEATAASGPEVFRDRWTQLSLRKIRTDIPQTAIFAFHKRHNRWWHSPNQQNAANQTLLRLNLRSSFTAGLE